MQKKYSVSSTSSLENTVSAYSSVNENADSLTVMLVNRDRTASRTVTINLSNFTVADGNYQTLRLSSLPAQETFVSHTQNALSQNTVAVNSNSLTITVPALSTTAILLVKATASVTYVTLTNRATGLLIDGMYRYSDGANAGQWSSSGSDAQQWSLETTGSYVKLKNRVSGLYLDGMGRTTSGGLDGQWSNSSSYNQQWQQETTGSYVKLKNRATGLYLDGLGQITNGADAGQWSESSSYNQQWTIGSVALARRSTVIDTLSSSLKMLEPTSNNVSVYPNPFSSTFNIMIDKPGEVERIVIFDVMGKQVEMAKRISVSSLMSMGGALKAGTYIVRVEAATWLKTFKVVKVN